MDSSLSIDGNLALTFQEKSRTELIDGKVTAMSPRPLINHNRVLYNIYRVFGNYLSGKPCQPFGDGVDLYLTKKDHFVPDFMIVCNKDKIKPTHVEGAPDLVVEVLSPSTARRDREYKKNAYERYGVREYWIVTPLERTVEQYVLEDGAFTLRDIYYHTPAYMMDAMTEEEKAEVVTEFRCSLFDDLSIRLADVFERVSAD